jgi:DUF1365 family protein
MTASAQVEHSCLYSGSIRHRRFTPVSNNFRYGMFMWYIDLDEVAALARQSSFFSLKRFSPFRFVREDYFGTKDQDVKRAVIDKVEEFFARNKTSHAQIRSVRVLTHIRYFGLIFNPVSFYYCFDAEENLVAILAEITNTPWGERHAYVLPFVSDGSANDGASVNTLQSLDDAPIKVTQERSDSRRFEFEKQFHVSPFNPMNMDYNWVFKAPGSKLAVHMENTMLKQAADVQTEHMSSVEKHFDATLGMERVPLEKAASVILKQPVMTLKVVYGIYWQALKLWVKRSPFYDHPSLSEFESNVEMNVALSKSGKQKIRKAL